jgi:predicted CopG family antitoxin
MVKVISLSDEAYKRLKALKHGKSFSEVVIELTINKKKKKDLSRFFEDRKKFKTRDVRL